MMCKMNMNLCFRKAKHGISGAPEIMDGVEAAAVCEDSLLRLWREGTATWALPVESLDPRLTTSLTSRAALESQCVSGHRISCPALIFDGVESLSSETEKKRPLHVGNKMRWVIQRASGCPGPEEVDDSVNNSSACNDFSSSASLSASESLAAPSLAVQPSHTNVSVRGTCSPLLGDLGLRPHLH